MSTLDRKVILRNRTWK